MRTTIAIIAWLRIIPRRCIIPWPAIIAIVRTGRHYHNRTGRWGRGYPYTRVMPPIAIGAPTGMMSPALRSSLTYYAKAEQDY
jgi:hypothetical protein